MNFELVKHSLKSILEFVCLKKKKGLLLLVAEVLVLVAVRCHGFHYIYV